MRAVWGYDEGGVYFMSFFESFGSSFTAVKTFCARKRRGYSVCLSFTVVVIGKVKVRLKGECGTKPLFRVLLMVVQVWCALTVATNFRVSSIELGLHIVILVRIMIRVSTQGQRNTVRPLYNAKLQNTCSFGFHLHSQFAKWPPGQSRLKQIV